MIENLNIQKAQMAGVSPAHRFGNRTPRLVITEREKGLTVGTEDRCAAASTTVLTGTENIEPYGFGVLVKGILGWGSVSLFVRFV